MSHKLFTDGLWNDFYDLKIRYTLVVFSVWSCEINQNFFIFNQWIKVGLNLCTSFSLCLLCQIGHKSWRQPLKTAAHEQIKKVKTQLEVDRNKNSDVKNSRKNPNSSFVVLLTKFFINGGIAKAFYFLCLQFWETHYKWPDTEIKRLTKKKCSIYIFSYLFRSTDFVTCK